MASQWLYIFGATCVYVLYIPVSTISVHFICKIDVHFNRNWFENTLKVLFVLLVVISIPTKETVLALNAGDPCG